MFKVEQRVLVKSPPPGVSDRNYPKAGVIKALNWMNTQPHKPWHKVAFADATWSVPEKLMVLACPVCDKEIKISNNFIEEHGNNSELCYGSFLPENY